jgi:hypothetical protein
MFDDKKHKVIIASHAPFAWRQMVAEAVHYVTKNAGKRVRFFSRKDIAKDVTSWAYAYMDEGKKTTVLQHSDSTLLLGNFSRIISQSSRDLWSAGNDDTLVVLDPLPHDIEVLSARVFIPYLCMEDPPSMLFIFRGKDREYAFEKSEGDILTDTCEGISKKTISFDEIKDWAVKTTFSPPQEPIVRLCWKTSNHCETISQEQ